MGLGEHVDCPAADDAVGGAGDDVVCVLCADYVDGVDWMGVTGSGEGCSLDWGGFGTCVPEQNLSAVCATNDEIGMEWGEFGREDVGLCVEDVFWAIVEMQIPDLD